MSMSLVVLLLLIAAAFVYLVFETVRHDRRRKAIPLLIAVTGTRGKSSVTRMLASVLREDGRGVLAKTTGSQAAFILPDGSEEPIRRRRQPSIIEQKDVIRRGAELSVDAMVIEVMSIHPENHLVETQQLLKPDTVLVTNFRVDHTAAMGETRDSVAAVLGLDVPRGGRVFVPERESSPLFRATVEERDGELFAVSAGSASLGDRAGLSIDEFGENLDLVYAAARSLGIDDRIIEDGVRRARPDNGALRVWRYRPVDSKPGCLVVNAFAANDPESTVIVHERVMAALDVDPGRCVGLLGLRSDRGDRTLQWVEALRGGFLNRFSRIYVMGLHATALVRRVRRWANGARIEVLPETRPSQIMQAVLADLEEEGVTLFGFGNMGGAGEALVAHWDAVGERLEV